MSTPEEQKSAATKDYALLSRTFAGGFKTGTCFLMIFALLWAMGLMALFYMVHMQIIFTNSGKNFITPADIPYLNKPDYLLPGAPVIRVSQAEIESWAWFIYASDLLLILTVAYIPAAFVMGMICSMSLWATGMPIFLLAMLLIELVKAGYFSWIWLIDSECERFPLCINRSQSGGFLGRDRTFFIETIATYVNVVFVAGFLIGSLIIYGIKKDFRNVRLAQSKMDKKNGGGGDSFNLPSASASRSERDVIVAEPIFCEAQEAEMRAAARALSQRHTKRNTSAKKTSSSNSALPTVSPVVAPANGNSHEEPPRLYLTRSAHSRGEDNLKHL